MIAPLYKEGDICNPFLVDLTGIDNSTYRPAFDRGYAVWFSA